MSCSGRTDGNLITLTLGPKIPASMSWSIYHKKSLSKWISFHWSLFCSIEKYIHDWSLTLFPLIGCQFGHGEEERLSQGLGSIRSKFGEIRTQICMEVRRDCLRNLSKTCFPHWSIGSEPWFTDKNAAGWSALLLSINLSKAQKICIHLL